MNRLRDQSTPKPVLAQLGLNGEAGAEMTIEGGALAEAGDDALVMGEFGNAGDKDLVW